MFGPLALLTRNQRPSTFLVSFERPAIPHPLKSLFTDYTIICLVRSPCIYPERETPIRGLCHGAFTDQFIFSYILESPPCL